MMKCGFVYIVSNREESEGGKGGEEDDCDEMWICLHCVK